MNYPLCPLLTLILLVYANSFYAATIDSLESVYLQTTDENKKMELALDLSFSYGNVDNKKAMYYVDEAFSLVRKYSDLNIIARIFESKGIIYNNLGDAKKALNYLFKALKIYENLDTLKQISVTTNSIANTYISINDFEKAEVFYTKSYSSAIKLNDSSAIGIPLIGLSIIYEKEERYTEALDVTKEAITFFDLDKRPDALAVCYVNAANYAYGLEEKNEARTWLDSAKRIAENLDNKYISGEISLIEARWLATSGNYTKAIEIGESGIHLLNEINAKANIMNGLKKISEIYAEAKKFENAYIKLMDYHDLKDSLNDENKLEIIEEMNAKYETVQKEKQISSLRSEKELHQLENKKNKTIILIAIVSLLILFLLMTLVFRAYRHKKNTNAALVEQKSIVEANNREIIESIEYAKRIQSAFLPSKTLLTELLGEVFVFYLPKDVVSGDFYWITKVDDTVLFAVADCTGHGVPGAMVSIVCHNALTRSVREFDLTQPSEILRKTREIVIDTFKSSDELVQDGMDISLCSLNKKTLELQWSGAYNPLFILRKENVSELDIIVGDRQPIGPFSEKNKFTNHKLKLNHGDQLFLLTDGFQDQFGGPNRKKYMVKRLKELIISIGNKNSLEQKNILQEEFYAWKRNYDQIDDVCIIGLKI